LEDGVLNKRRKGGNDFMPKDIDFDMQCYPFEHESGEVIVVAILARFVKDEGNYMVCVNVDVEELGLDLDGLMTERIPYFEFDLELENLEITIYPYIINEKKELILRDFESVGELEEIMKYYLEEVLVEIIDGIGITSVLM